MKNIPNVSAMQPSTHVRTSLLCAVLVILLTIGIFTLLGGTGHPLTVKQLTSILFGSGSGSENYLLLQLRLPRLLLAILVGSCLGMSGALFQGLTRNPLGSPDVIGINAGAATGALLVILVLHAGETQTPTGALLGGLATGLIVFSIASKHRMNPTRLVLAGIAIGPLLTSVNSFLLLRADVDNAENAARWLVGSLNGADWERVSYLALTILLVAPLAMLLTKPLVLMGMGDDLASALGVNVSRTRIGVTAVASILAALATATSGPIGFVALAAPHLARWIAPGNIHPIISAVVGAVMLVSADFLATYTTPSLSLPVGTVTGLLGGAYLALYLGLQARRTKRGMSL
ncbi:iron chelate uptake ABC transporter family permease subunit [Glutamicibacter sp. JL.03c]|uniref:FecCD family ABC transporter permease n=1 Tax=Glutamicibacter sp. JL.03c TaxID=2984842 RepID=UPI0021F6A17D|nr:iron chelate uptake ABC transporter family permease subunit [Glutamicibacter sp. JL.03c]UYQ77765.1 iron chelate uptake ABC transporter family permease subunit [Glutamicibacter sp. JL.03c]